MAARSLFVTGTDTGVGKTVVACALVHALSQQGQRVLGMKPVASGSEMTDSGLRNDDALQLQQASSVPVPYEQMNPYCFAPPIAPHLAAAQVGVTINLETLLAAHQALALQAQVVVVEGAGGWRVPLNEQAYFSALPQRAGMDVVLVVGLRLGCINHAVLTREAIARDGCRLVGWVGNQVDAAFATRDENLRTLQQRLDAPCWGVLPHVDHVDARLLAPKLEVARIQAWANAREHH